MLWNNVVNPSDISNIDYITYVNTEKSPCFCHANGVLKCSFSPDVRIEILKKKRKKIVVSMEHPRVEAEF